MSATTMVPSFPPLLDDVRLAVAGFVARHSGPTRVSYSCERARNNLDRHAAYIVTAFVAAAS